MMPHRSFNSTAIALTFALAGILHLGCDGPGSPGRTPIPPAEWDCNRTFTELPIHEAPGIATAQSRIVDNEADWCDLWDDLQASTIPPPPCDKSLVDFSREVVLLAALGVRPSAGYSVKIDCIHGDESDPDFAEVMVVETYPGPNCVVALVMTYPVALVKVERPLENAIFHSRSIAEDCH